MASGTQRALADGDDDAELPLALRELRGAANRLSQLIAAASD